MAQKHDSHEGIPAEHLFYGAVQVGRVQGNRSLFRSAVMHSNYINLAFSEVEQIIFEITAREAAEEKDP